MTKAAPRSACETFTRRGIAQPDDHYVQLCRKMTTHRAFAISGSGTLFYRADLRLRFVAHMRRDQGRHQEAFERARCEISRADGQIEERGCQMQNEPRVNMSIEACPSIMSLRKRETNPRDDDGLAATEDAPHKATPNDQTIESQIPAVS